MSLSAKVFFLGVVARGVDCGVRGVRTPLPASAVKSLDSWARNHDNDLLGRAYVIAYDWQMPVPTACVSQ